MWGYRIMTSAVFALATVNSMTAIAAEADATLRAELERVAQRRIFFGHQSVGDNLIDGITALASKAGVPIRIAKVPSAKDVPSATLGHAYVDRNEEPLMKLRSFENALGEQASGVDIALVKFCYVDIKADTDAKALFASYRNALDGLKARNPGTTFVHVTAPLTSEQKGTKEFLKRLLGRSGAAQNARREEFNSLMRKTYQGQEPIFDLARAESTGPGNTTTTVKWDGQTVPALAQAYTNDGGHLNPAGRLHVAREFISVLAAIPAQTTKNKPAR